MLRDIRETVAKCSKSFCALNFEGAEYLDEQGKSRPMYLMTKDGFTMVAMAYTTPEAVRFKEAYIAEFNRMEAELQRGTQQSLPEFPAKIEAAAIILRVAGITGNQAALSLVDILPLKGDFTMHLTNKGPHTRAFVLSIILKIFNRFDKYSYG